MSEPLPNSTTLSNLRQFRLQKSSSNRTELLPGKKRIQVMADSDSDGADAHVQKKVKAVLSTKEKEERFLSASKISPQYDTMDIQDGLVRNNWDVSECVRYLKEKCHPKKKYSLLSIKNQNSIPQRQVGSSQMKFEKKMHLLNPSANLKTLTKLGETHSSKYRNYSDFDDSDADVKDCRDHVYDSEGSDSDLVPSNEMSKQRKSVFDFMNTSTLLELQTIKSCSEKKAQIIISLRPFENWRDLCTKLEQHKTISPDLLNYCQELINKQNNVAAILEKCNKLVKKLEVAVETGAGNVELPKSLNSKLKLTEYQIIGLNWLIVMHNVKMNSILADEMGLGKTIQVIAFLSYLKENNLAKAAHLIVVLSSTMENWEAEIAKWCPNLVVEKYYGNQDERRRMRVRYAKEGFKGFDIVLTTYKIVSSTPEERKLFRVCKMHYVIFDEAHMLKNMTSQRYSNLITINAEMRILLTGTPIQNNLLELMSLLCFVMPSFFVKNIEDIKSLFAKKSKSETEDSSKFQKTQIERAKRIMKPFVLRRLKSVVLTDLPEKTEHVLKVAMLDKQKEYYNSLVDYYTNHKGEVCNSGISVMVDLRKTANHPLLMRHYFTDDVVRTISKRLATKPSFKTTNPEHVFEELAVYSDFQIWQICQKYELKDVSLPDQLFCDSGKFKLLDTLLPELKKNDHRVLFFSQFTRMLDIAEKYLNIRNYDYLRLDGQTAVDTRQDLIDNFNTDSDIFIFLLSTKAGGVGINLTAADTAIIHDIDFNPYNDKQAEDRCHRIGQTRPVNIYRLISENTIEEGILMIAKEKLKLEEDINSEKKDIQEHKCMVRLLTMALGLDEKETEKLNNSTSGSINDDIV